MSYHDKEIAEIINDPSRWPELKEAEVDWGCISKYQKLSEDFIREFKDEVDWDWISWSQKLSGDFIKEFQLTISDNNWLYKTREYKLEQIKACGLYEIEDDEYIIAYKAVRNDNHSVYNFQYLYEVGKTYESHCDCNIDNENSFGLSAWTQEAALDYYNQGKLFKVKIHIDDLGALVHEGNKLRCFKLEIIEEII